MDFRGQKTTFLILNNSKRKNVFLKSNNRNADAQSNVFKSMRSLKLGLTASKERKWSVQ